MKIFRIFGSLSAFLPSILLAGPISVYISDSWSSGGGNNYGQAIIAVSTPTSSLSYTLPTTQFIQYGAVNVAPAFDYNTQITPATENYLLSIPLGQARNLNEAVLFNGNSLTLSQHSLLLNLQIGPWTGGTLVAQPQADPNGRPDYFFSVTGGTVTSLTGTIELRDAAGNCLFCESIVSGAGTISSSTRSLYPTTSSANTYSLSGLTDASNAVPEPSSVILAGIGLAFAAAWKRLR